MSSAIEIKISETNKSPPLIVGDGKLTPRLISQWERHANAYFQKMKVSENEKVPAVLNCFSGVDLQLWVDMHREKFVADDFTFTSFMTQMRTSFLSPSWEKETLRKEVYVRMGTNQTFRDWSASVMSGNTLVGTTHGLSLEALRNHLLMNMSSQLASKIDSLKKLDKETLEAIEDFDEWRCEIIAIDDARRSDMQMATQVALETLKRQRPDTDHVDARPPPPLRTSRNYNEARTSNNYSRNFSSFGTGSNAIGQERLPRQFPSAGNRAGPLAKLTDGECRILGEHDGCRKCRRTYVSCRSHNCMSGVPDGASYRELTVQDALRTRDELMRIGPSYRDRVPSRNTHPNQVFGTPAPTAPRNNGVYNIGNSSRSVHIPPVVTSSASIVELPDDENVNGSVAAVLPSSGSTTSFVLGDGFDTSEDEPSDPDEPTPST